MKSNQVVRCVVSGMRMTFVVVGAGQFEFDAAAASGTDTARESLSDVGLQALLHGFRQKISDAAAIPRDPKTGQSATPGEKLDAMAKVAERLMNGEWNQATRERTDMLLEALAALYPGKMRADLADYLAKKTKGERAGLAADPRVAAKITELMAAKGDAAMGAEMLDELENL